MNIPSALTIGTEERLKHKAHRLNPLGILAWIAARFRTHNYIKTSKASSGTAPSNRLGEIVYHGNFGTGRVLAHWPDGTLLVRFDREAKSRLVWPSLLDRANGRR